MTFRHPRQAAALGIAALFCLGLASCSAPPSHVAGQGPEGVSVAEVSAAAVYPDMASILDAATLFVTAQPTSSREEVVGDIPFTVVTFEVGEASGKDSAGLGTSIDVRYSGGAKLSFANLPALPYKGLTYALALRPFTFDGKTPTNQYIVVGPGQWVDDDHSGSFDLDVISYEAPDGASVPITLDSSALEGLRADITG